MCVNFVTAQEVNQNYFRFACGHIATIHHQSEVRSCFTTFCGLIVLILFNIIQWLQYCFHTNCNQPAPVFKLVPDIGELCSAFVGGRF